MAGYHFSQVYLMQGAVNGFRRNIRFPVVQRISCGSLLGREALGRFVDMSAIGASIGNCFISTSTLLKMKREKE